MKVEKTLRLKLLDKYKDDFLAYRKALAVFILQASGMVLLVAYLVFLRVYGDKLFDPPTKQVFVVSATGIIITTLLALGLLIRGKLNLSVDFWVTVTVLNLIGFSFYRVAKDFGYFSIFLDTYYFLMIFYVIGGVFSTEKIAYLNFLLLLVSVWAVLFYGLPEFDAEFKTHFIRATISYTILLLILFFVTRFSVSSMNKVFVMLTEEKQKNEENYYNLKRLVLYVKDANEHLLEASKKLNELSEKIAEKAKDQAVSSEEVASSTEEMAATVEHSKRLSDQTYKKAIDAVRVLRETITKLNETIANFLTISDKVSVISQIAEKTDILAINAAIEAAHAGEYGKGFAVVAAEIRKLSDNAKKAAEDISELVGITRDISNETQQSFNNVAQSILETTTLIESINYASDELLNGINHINQAINQLSSIAEHNSNAAQIMAEDSKKLVDLAAKLQEVMRESDNMS